MSDETQEPEQAQQTFSYRVIRGSIRKPRGETTRQFVNRGDFFNQGDLLPDGLFGEDDIQSWLEGGRIEPAQVSAEMAAEATQAITARGKWQVDPSSLVGKTMEELLIMVNEIDEDYDANSLADEREAVALLTSDWDPRYADRIAPVSDRSRPQALVAHDLEQVNDVPATSMRNVDQSEQAADALASARAKAQAPAVEAE